MTNAKRVTPVCASLRKSIFLGVKQAVHDMLLVGALDDWRDAKNRWQGPLVEEEIKLVWIEFLAWYNKSVKTMAPITKPRRKPKKSFKARD